MARPMRIEFRGAVYHVTSRGNTRQAIPLSGIQHGYTFQKIPPQYAVDKEIAEYYGVHYTAVSRAIQKVEEKYEK